MRFTWIPAVVLVGGVLLGVGWWAGSAGNEPSQTDVASDPTLVAQVLSLREEIAALRDLVESTARPAPEASRLPADVDRHDELAAIFGRLEALGEALEGMRSLLALVSADVESEAPDPAIPKNEGAVDAACRRLEADEEMCELYHFCWTRSQVYRTYGKPDGTYQSSAIEWWYYPGQAQNGIKFVFIDGLVTHVGRVRSPNPR